MHSVNQKFYLKNIQLYIIYTIELHVLENTHLNILALDFLLLSDQEKMDKKTILLLLIYIVFFGLKRKPIYLDMTNKW